MGDIIAPNGSPLSVAVIGVANMDASLAFYCDIIGLTASAPRIWDGEQFEKLWKLPPGSKANAVFVNFRASASAGFCCLSSMPLSANTFAPRCGTGLWADQLELLHR